MSVSSGIADLAKKIENGGDCVRLGERKFYDPYFATLNNALRALSEFFRNHKELGDKHTWVFHPVIERLLATIGLLCLKQQYDPNQSTALDLNQSGFPHSSAINQLSADLTRRTEELAHAPDGARARHDLLDVLLVQHREDPQLLWDIARRAYFEQLSEDRVFGQFNFHEIVEYPAWECKKPNRRPYLVTWGCFDQTANLPLLHMMIIEQDVAAEPLHLQNEIHRKFLDVLRAEGARFVELGFMATMIDGKIESVHPKFIRRIQIGPFHSAQVRFGDLVHPFVNLIEKQTDVQRGFVLEFEIENLLSVDENIVRQGMFKKEAIRQVFLIPSDVTELRARRITGVEKYLFLPHRLSQMIDWSNPVFENWKQHKQATIDTEGEVHVF